MGDYPRRLEECKEKGIIKAFVNGGRNPKNKNVSATDLLCYSDFSVEKTKKVCATTVAQTDSGLSLTSGRNAC